MIEFKKKQKSRTPHYSGSGTTGVTILVEFYAQGMFSRETITLSCIFQDADTANYLRFVPLNFNVCRKVKLLRNHKYIKP